jgi:hypothetical protein
MDRFWGCGCRTMRALAREAAARSKRGFMIGEWRKRSY